MPMNFPKLLQERGFNSRLSANRPFIFLQYCGPDGNPYYLKEDTAKENPYALARFLGPVGLWKGDEPPPKVIAQNGRPNVLHYEPLRVGPYAGKTWGDLPEGTKVLHLESMVKARAVHKWTGVPCIGLNGVESYSSSRRGVRFLYEDQDIDFSKFYNVVLFDSNIWKKPVADARERLLFKFKHVLGCREVGFVDLPKSITGEDWGPDDFLAANGNAALEALIATPTAYSGGSYPELINKMGRAVFCTGSGTIVDRQDHRVRSTARARDFYAPINEKEISKGGITKTIPGFTIWLESPHRTEVVNPTYRYLGEEFVEKEDGTYYNLYQSGGAWPNGSEGDEAAPIIAHLRQNMSEGDLELMRSYLRYLKFTPGKPTSFPVMYSDKRGVGKGYFGQLSIRLLGANNSVTGSSETFATKFNVELEGKRLILINELKVKGGEKDRVMNNIKTFIADPTTRIERKGVDAYEIESSTGLIVNANALEDVPNDGMEDRRIWYVACHMPEGGLSENYWNPLWALLNDDVAMRAFAAWVKSGKDIDFSTWRPPMDEARQEAILSSMGPTSVAAFEVLTKLRAEGYKVVSLALIRHLMGLQSMPHLEQMSDPSLAGALKRDGVWKTSDKKYGKNGEQKKVWIVDESWYEQHLFEGVVVSEEVRRAASELGTRSKF